MLSRMIRLLVLRGQELVMSMLVERVEKLLRFSVLVLAMLRGSCGLQGKLRRLKHLHSDLLDEEVAIAIVKEEGE